jgi:MerR family transcriptional regulator/heat shock protein HspR
MKRDEPCLTIGVVARMLGVHPHTLRMYEKEGLVVPQRSAGNTRLYSERDIARLRYIQHLTSEEGVNLAGVRSMLRLHEHYQRQMAMTEQEHARMVEYLVEMLRLYMRAATTEPGSSLIPLSIGGLVLRHWTSSSRRGV